MNKKKHPKGDIVDGSDTKEMMKMAAYFSRKKATKMELIISVIASVIFYGVAFGMLVLLIIKAP